MQDDSSVSVRLLGWVTLAWAVGITAVLVWQASTYSGLYALLAEWQFRTFEKMFPVPTIFLPALLLTIPFLILMAWRLASRRRFEGQIGRVGILERDRLVFKAILAITILAATVAIVFMILGLRVGLADTKVTSDLRDPGNINIPDGGRAQVSGWALVHRTGFYNERILWSGRDLYVVPLTRNASGTRLQVFVEVPKPPANLLTGVAPPRPYVPVQRVVTGVARRAALPGGLARLYQYAGYDVVQPTYVIFQDTASARWPFFSAAADFAMLALLLALGTAAMAWHLRRLKARIKTGHQST